MEYFKDKLSQLEENLDTRGDLSKAKNLIMELLDVVTDTILEKNPEKLQQTANCFGYLDYRFNRDIADRRVFLLGQVKAFYMISNQLGENLANTDVIKTVKQSKYGFRILEAINNQKLPTHKQLADAVGISPSQLTRTLKTIAAARAVTFSDLGKHRYYSLTDIGKIALEKTEKQQLLPQLLELIEKVDNQITATLEDERVIALKLANEAGFTPAQIETVIATLKRLRQREKITPLSSKQLDELSKAPKINSSVRETELSFRTSGALSKESITEIIKQLKSPKKTTGANE